jgi:hypothetical protein
VQHGQLATHIAEVTQAQIGRGGMCDRKLNGSYEQSVAHIHTNNENKRIILLCELMKQKATEVFGLFIVTEVVLYI